MGKGAKEPGARELAEIAVRALQRRTLCPAPDTMELFSRFRVARIMTNPSVYLKKAQACADDAGIARDPPERAALLQMSQCLILLADYVATRREHGTAHREDDQQASQLDS